MTLLEEYERKWADDDPMDPRYDDHGNKICPNERRFDRIDGNRHWLGDGEQLDQELDFND